MTSGRLSHTPFLLSLPPYILSFTLAQQRIRLSRCPCRSRPRSGRAVFSVPLSSTSFSHRCSSSSTSSSSSSSTSSSSLLSRVQLLARDSGYLQPIIRRGWVEGEGGIFTSRARRGRHTHTCTHARTEIRRREGENGRAEDGGGRDRSDGGREGGWRRGDGSYRTARHIGA